MAFFTACLCVITFVEAGLTRKDSKTLPDAERFLPTGQHSAGATLGLTLPGETVYAATSPRSTSIPDHPRPRLGETVYAATSQMAMARQADLEAGEAQLVDLGMSEQCELAEIVTICNIEQLLETVQALHYADLQSALLPCSHRPEKGHLHVKLNFIKDEIEKDARLYVKEGDGQPRINPEVVVSVLTDMAEVEEEHRRNYALDQNGFQIVDFLNDRTERDAPLSVGLQELLYEMHDDSEGVVEYRQEWSRRIRQETELFVKAWRGEPIRSVRSSNLIHAFVTLDAVFRNTASGDFGAVRLVHSDFERGQTLHGFITAFGDMWFKHLWNNPEFREAAGYVFGHHLDESALREQVLADHAKPVEQQLFWRYWKVIESLNVWVCLTKGGIEADQFAMMDSSTLKGAKRVGTAGWTSGPQLKRYVATRRNAPSRPGRELDIIRSDEFHAIAVHPEEQNRWVFRKSMPFGQAYVFDSMATPHTAFQTDEEIAERQAAADAGKPYTGPTRQSVESRTLQLVFDKNAASWFLVD